MTEDLFALLGLPRRFDLDSGDLEQRYYRLQREHHPDRAGAGGQAQSIALNRAYATLKGPLSRARHLLELQGIEIAPPPEVLAESMEWREALQEAGSREEIYRLSAKAEAARETCLSAMEKSFSAEIWQEAAKETLRLGYLEKLREEILSAEAA